MNAIVKSDDRQRVIATPGMFSDPTRFEFAQRVATVFANSNLVPTHLKGKLPDCLIALHMAERLGEDPLTTMQNIMVVNGKPGFMTSYMIARTNRSGVFDGPITWETTGTGKELSVRAVGVLSGSGKTVSATADMAMAIAEGWTKNTKYQSMPEHMLRFRSAAMLIRLYCPEVMLGMQTVEELESPDAAMKDVTPVLRATRVPPPPSDVPAKSAIIENVATTQSKPPAPPVDIPTSDSVAPIVAEFSAACAAAKTDDDLSEVMADFQSTLETATADERDAMHLIYEQASERITATTSTLAAG